MEGTVRVVCGRGVEGGAVDIFAFRQGHGLINERILAVVEGGGVAQGPAAVKDEGEAGGDDEKGDNDCYAVNEVGAEFFGEGEERGGGGGKGKEGITANRRSGQGIVIISPIIPVRVVSGHAVIQHGVAITVFAARVLE